jgi:hypothetical protein
MSQFWFAFHRILDNYVMNSRWPNIPAKEELNNNKNTEPAYTKAPDITEYFFSIHVL